MTGPIVRGQMLFCSCEKLATGDSPGHPALLLMCCLLIAIVFSANKKLGLYGASALR